MTSQTYEKYSAFEVTPAMLEDAVTLFNEHYGVWGKDPSLSIRAPKEGMSDCETFFTALNAEQGVVLV